MGGSDDGKTVREFYRAYAEQDGATLLKLMAEDLEVHVSGNHPLSGHYRGQEEVFGYIGKVGAWTGGEGGFAVDAVLADEKGHVAALVTATAFHDGVKFERPLLHLFTLRDGAIVESRDLPFDQHAEDAFWAGP